MFGDLVVALKIAGRIIPAIRELKKGLRKDSEKGKKLSKNEKDRILKALLPAMRDLLDEVEDDIG